MQSKELIRKAAEAIWAIRREEEDRCDMSLDDMGGEESSVWHEAKAALEAALSTDAEPVGWHIPGSTAITKDKDVTDRWRLGNPSTVIDPVFAAPPAPYVAVKALQMADETFRDLGWHDKYEATTAALAALSAQVQEDNVEPPICSTTSAAEDIASQVEPIPQNKETLNQVAAIMLQWGTPAQQDEAIAYLATGKVAQVQDVAGNATISVGEQTIARLRNGLSVEYDNGLALIPSSDLSAQNVTDDEDIGPHEKALRDAVEPFLDWLEQREEGAHIKEVREGLIGVEDVIPDDHVVLGAHLRAQKDDGVLTIGHFRRLQAAYDGKLPAAPAKQEGGTNE